MLLVESLKQYAGLHKTDKAILSYLNTEYHVAQFDVCIHTENVTEEWILKFKDFAGGRHAGNVRRVLKHSTSMQIFCK